MSDCQHTAVWIEGRVVSPQTWEEPEESEFRAICKECGEVLEIGELQDGTEETAREWEHYYYEEDL